MRQETLALDYLRLGVFKQAGQPMSFAQAKLHHWLGNTFESCSVERSS